MYKDNNINILRDTRANGKDRDWKGKKKRSLLMADHYGEAGLNKKAERMQQCADTLLFKKTAEKLKLFQAYFCKVRLCPMCNWRRSLKIAFHNKQIVEAANQRENLKWIFLTLTVRNVEGKELKTTMDSMTKAWNRFAGYAKFKKSIKGYFRAMEVTKNRERESEWYGTYHPHFHVLLCVPASYFKKPNLYVKQENWIAMWRKAMKLDYDPIVHVQRVKAKKESLDLNEIEQDIKKAVEEQNAILEVSKYPVKDSDVIVGDSVTVDNVETILDLDNALSYKRLIAYGGLLKEIHRELNLGDAEDGDLIHVGEENSDEVANGAVEIMAYWHVGLKNYVIK
ncbi:protein rep [Domibacillus indicus]|uniref:protein rep n=1 Tax=Domibacillus indicus TaxID=1437523 RepID=UPI000617E5E9|nr:protein rep [Domibacillus indicus]